MLKLAKTSLAAICALGLAAPLAVPAFAADKAEASSANQDEMMGDPTRVICRRQDSTGSRLQAKRVCATAGEWAAKRMAERETIEKAQTQRWKSE